MKFLLAIGINAITLLASAQHFDKKALDDYVRQMDSAFNFQHSVYVIQGILFSSTEDSRIDSILCTEGLRNLVSIDILKEPTTSGCWRNSAILVTFAYDQKLKNKKALLKKVKRCYINKRISVSGKVLNGNEPILYINNELVDPFEARQAISSLTLEHVFYIDIDEKEISAANSGYNANNSLLRIWTFPKDANGNRIER